MKSIIEVSASTTELQDHFDMLSCFLKSATTLHAVACDGMVGRGGNIEQPTPEYWNEHFVAAFFLFRHALELSIKALIKEATGVDVCGHDIKKMWETNIPDYRNVIPEKINTAFAVLAKFHVLNDAQLFRYHADKDGIKLKNMPLIRNDDFDAISDAAWAIRQLILECIHVKKGLPIT
jgi:hypothetical protein